MVGDLDNPVSNGQFQTELKELTFWKYLEIIKRVIRVFTIPTRAASQPLPVQILVQSLYKLATKTKKLTVIPVSL